MDAKSLHTLELPKILERLAKHASFSAGAALARALQPTTDLAVARRRQQETSEARRLLAVKTDATIGGARDIRPLAQSAARGGVLLAEELLEVKTTIIAARSLGRLLERLADQFPRLAGLASGIQEMPGLVEAISRTIDERGEVLDSASEKLAGLRRDLRSAHDRLLDKLQRILSDSRHATHLQEFIITQRDGRYVLPVKADFKGRLRGIVHDQSSSGATLFVEPLATVEMNNAWRELQLAEQQEIRRILAALSAQIGEQSERLIWAVEALAELDLAFAKAKYADALRASEPILHALEAAGPAQAGGVRAHPGSVVRLLAARHPLLNQETVVPVDAVFDDETYALVITGPNTGGKTVSLKTVGLLALMAQCGLHLPVASGSELSLFHNIFADIGDEQSIEQSLSTFSSHLVHTIRILSQANAQALVILDELGAGTDPAEGSALARAILSYLLDLGATTLVATHYPELKGYAHSTAGVRNASLEFDLETLAPTYRLIIGLPGRSNAFAIAARLGLDATIVAEARTMVAQSDLQAEQLLDEIHRQREITRQERARAESAREDAEKLERRLAKQWEVIDEERRKILDQARAEGQKEIESLREELSELKRRLARANAPLEEVHAVEAALETAEERQAVPAPSVVPRETPRGRKRAPRLGDTVKVKSLNTIGVITALSTTDVEVRVGRMRVRARLDEIEMRGSPEPEEVEAPARLPAAPVSPGLELDIRGQMVEDALIELERYLDAAYAASLPWVRLIHGKGTGRLRQGVRDYLRANSLVKSYAAGKEEEGGDGTTIVKLAIED